MNEIELHTLLNVLQVTVDRLIKARDTADRRLDRMTERIKKLENKENQ